MNVELWKKHNYQVVWTEDQSPTLQSLTTDRQPGVGFATPPPAETMHHRGGAYSETQLIYGEPLRWGLERGASHILSLGLGLAYNEILVAQETSSRGLKNWTLSSYEKDPFLVGQFLLFLKKKMTNETLSEDLKIYAHIAERFAVSRAALETLLDKKEKGEWRVEGALSAQTKMDQKFHVILYDAYSSKTDTDLWTEEFLQVFLAKAAAEKCIFTTYACTGPLKRSLKQAGFEVTLREGFHGKRQSTLATRGF